MVPLSWFGIAVAAALALGAFVGYRWEANRWDADIGRQQAAAAQAAQQQAVDSTKVEKVYVDRIQKVEVPVDRIRTRIVRAACGVPERAGGAIRLPAGHAAKPADGAGGTDADPELLGDLAREIPAAVRNGIKASGCQALIRANAQP